MTKPGCTIIGTVVAKPDKRDELMRILAAQVAPTRAELGCINHDFHCDESDPNTFAFYENFVSKEAHEEHLKKAHLKPLIDRLDELLSEPVNIRHLEMRSLPAEQ
jgi:quinol monooxygenase YgiN